MDANAVRLLSWIRQPGAVPTDPVGPVFISYRQLDGTPYATRTAALLRSSGVPVWRDQDDLPPGDTKRRLREALSGGLSGAVLLVTPDIGNSTIVRKTELPTILRLARSSPFIFVIGSAVRSGGKTAYKAADELLRRKPGTLSGTNQYDITSDGGIMRIVEAVLNRRIELQRNSGAFIDREFHIDVQTRSAPRAADHTSDLPIRLMPKSTGRFPLPEAIRDVCLTLPLLPKALERAGATAVRITGRSHLSVACAIGSAVPGTFFGQVVVEDTTGARWVAPNVALTARSERLVVDPIGEQSSGRHRVFVQVDTVPTVPDRAFERLIERSSGHYDAAIRIRLVTRELIEPTDGGPLASEIAGLIRQLSRTHGSAEVHLALYVPFPMALLIGRLLNTLDVTLYEWAPPESSSSGSAEYVPVLRVRTTNGNALLESLLPVTAE